MVLVLYILGGFVYSVLGNSGIRPEIKIKIFILIVSVLFHSGAVSRAQGIYSNTNQSLESILSRIFLMRGWVGEK